MRNGDRITAEWVREIQEASTQSSGRARQVFQKLSRRLSSIELALLGRSPSAPQGKAFSGSEPGRLYLPLTASEGTRRQGPVVATAPTGEKPVEVVSTPAGDWPELLSPGRIASSTEPVFRARTAAAISEPVTEVLLPVVGGAVELTLYLEEGPRELRAEETTLFRFPTAPWFTGRLELQCGSQASLSGSPVYSVAAPYLFGGDLPPETATGAAVAELSAGPGPQAVPAGPVSIESARLWPSREEVPLEVYSEGSRVPSGSTVLSGGDRLQVEAQMSGRQWASLLEVEYRL